MHYCPEAQVARSTRRTPHLRPSPRGLATLILAAAAVTLSASCAEVSMPQQPATELSLSALVVTVPGTYFYPPLAPTPTPTGTFNATLLPQLSVILEATDTSGNTTTVGTFTQSTTPALQLVLLGQMYFVNIPASAYFTNPGLAYRVRVMWNAQQLGFADVSSTVFTVMQTVPNLLFGVKVRIETRPPPTLISLSPPTGIAGGPTFTLTLTGTNFATDSVVYFNGVPVATTYVSSTVLTAVIPAGSYPTAGNYPVYVYNPGPGGGNSNVLNWIATPPPVVGPLYCGSPAAPVAAPTGAHLFSRRFGGAQSQTSIKTASDPSGNVFLNGFFYGTIDFGGGPMTTAATGFAQDQFLVKLDSAGNHVWSKHFVATRYNTPTSLVVGCDGSVYVGGFFDGTLDFGGGALTSQGNNEVYIAKFDANGNHLWSHSFGDVSYQWVWHMAIDSQGSVIIIGGNDSTVDFGGGPLTTAGGEDGFVAKFDANGNHLWSRLIGSPGYEFLYAVAVDGQDRIIVTGNFDGTIDFGGVIATSLTGYDTFIAVYDPNGAAQWVRQFNTATNYTYFYAVGADAAGDVVAAGTFNGGFDFGAGLLVSAGGTDDLVILKLGPTGNTLWSTPFGSATDWEGVEGMVVDAAGGITAAGNVLVKVDAGGNVLWNRPFYGNAVRGISVDPSGNLLVTGELSLTFDFGGGPLTSAGATDVYIAKYAP